MFAYGTSIFIVLCGNNVMSKIVQKNYEPQTDSPAKNHKAPA